MATLTHGLAGEVDALVAIEPDPHLHDAPVLHDEVGDRWIGAGAVDDRCPRKQRACRAGRLAAPRGRIGGR
jgi:hypothetical protein